MNEYENDEPYQYMCLTCGKTDVEDYEDESDQNRSMGGVVFTRNGFEVFICSYCRYIIEGH